MTLDLPLLLSLDDQCRPVSASSEDQSVLVGASLDQLLWVTLEWLAQSSLSNLYYLRQFLQAFLLAVVNTVTGEHSIKNEASLYSRSNWQWGSFIGKLLAILLKLGVHTLSTRAGHGGSVHY